LKISNNNEYFPGTEDRVLGLYGSADAIRALTREVVKKILEQRPDVRSDVNASSLSNPVSTTTPSPVVQMDFKVLVPTLSSSFIIGKGGANIRSFGESASNKGTCKVVLADIADPYNTKERIMQVKGTAVEDIVQAVINAFDHLVSGDPKHLTYANPEVKYDSHGPPMPGMYMMGQQMGGSMAGYGGAAVPRAGPYGGAPFAGNKGAPSRGPPPSYYPPAGVPPGRYDHQGAAGYGDVMGRQPTPGYGARPGYGPPADPYGGGNPYGGAAPTPTHHGGAVTGGLTGVGEPIYTTDGVNIKMTLPIADTLVGTVLGKGAANLKETVNISKAQVLVSKQNEHIPGTTQRYVQVIGTQQQVQVALQIIYSKVQTTQAMFSTGVYR